MEILDAVLAITELTKERATRTVIQKLCYFLKVEGLLDVTFRPHYFGPYSDEVQESLSFLVGLGFVDEVAERFETTFPRQGWRRYKYTIMDDGKTILEQSRNGSEYSKVEEIIKICRKFSDFNLDILSSAAKIHYILGKKGIEMNEPKICEEAHKLGWEMTPQNTKKAIYLLEELNLVRRSA